MNPLQLTLAILKPDLLMRPHAVKAVYDLIVREGFCIVRSVVIRWQYEQARRFYCEHQDKFFYQRLVHYMCSGPLNPMILAHPNAIRHWRILMGPTKSYVAQATAPHTIRGMYGLTDTRNSTHGSDSEESMKRETSFFFPDFSPEQWYQDEEPVYQNRSSGLRTGSQYDPRTLLQSVSYTDCTSKD